MSLLSSFRIYTKKIGFKKEKTKKQKQKKDWNFKWQTKEKARLPTRRLKKSSLDSCVEKTQSRNYEVIIQTPK